MKYFVRNNVCSECEQTPFCIGFFKDDGTNVPLYTCSNDECEKNDIHKTNLNNSIDMKYLRKLIMRKGISVYEIVRYLNIDSVTWQRYQIETLPFPSDIYKNLIDYLESLDDDPNYKDFREV